jgi:hypothetical protein
VEALFANTHRPICYGFYQYQKPALMLNSRAVGIALLH